jgi:hypothetical protein
MVLIPAKATTANRQCFGSMRRHTDGAAFSGRGKPLPPLRRIAQI